MDRILQANKIKLLLVENLRIMKRIRIAVVTKERGQRMRWEPIVLCGYEYVTIYDSRFALILQLNEMKSNTTPNNYNLDNLTLYSNILCCFLQLIKLYPKIN